MGQVAESVKEQTMEAKQKVTVCVV